MLRLAFYQIDAFTREAFGGNPAGVCALEKPIGEELMLAIAREKNLPATAFFAPEGDAFALRWFAPAGELGLCGHGTLAAGFVLLNLLHRDRTWIAFRSGAGALQVRRAGDRFALDFPALAIERECGVDDVATALGARPSSVWEAAGGRGLAVLDDPAQVRDLRPNVAAIAELSFSALIVTARGWPADCDFVSRYFAPKHGIAEDYVTGSAHCVLTPYWSSALGKRTLFARQLSSRGGEVWVEDRGERVGISGECVPIAEGTLTIP